MSPLLKKSFDPAKCKTLLQITGQKLKVLRNKHALAVKNSRTDVARLLEKNQDENAKMEVDRVNREEKIVVLYNLLEQFCQFLSSHIETMKSQRECPLDLKEAVASLIYAASRCDEIEELKKVSVYLTRRYGTEFSLAAKELHSGCSVNTLVIQNLSSLSLSLDGKIKLLKDIAAEKKINWDCSAYEQPSGSHLLEDTITQSASGTSTSALSGFEGQNSSSMHGHEIGGQQSGALKNVISSHIVSPKASLDSRPGSSGKNVTAFISDPYASAKSLGRLDYKFVSDSLAGEHVVEAHMRTTSSLPSYDQSPLSGSLSVAPRQPTDSAARQEMERQLLQLESVTKVAYESATEAAKATKLVVSMVKKQTVEMRNLQLEGIKRPVGRHSGSSFSPVLAESSFDYDGDKLRFALSEDDLGLGAALSNVAPPEDVGEIQSKYVVSEQKTGSQWRSPRGELAKDNIMGKSRPVEKPMIESLSSTDGKQLEVDRKSGHGEKQEVFHLQEKSVQSLPRYDDSISDDEEMPYYYPEKASPGQQQQHEDVSRVAEMQQQHEVQQQQQHEGLSRVAEMQQDKEELKECAKPQFDDDGSASSDEEETASDARESAHSGPQQQQQQHRSLSSEAELQQERVEEEPHQVDGDDSEEEIPFYMKGRAAQMKADFDDNDDELATSHSDSRADGRTGPSCSASPSGGLSDDEGEKAAIQVRRHLRYGSASSPPPELKAESSIESYKPSRPQGSSLQSPKMPSAASSSSLDSGLAAPDSPLSRRTSYMGIFKRALRPSRQ